jgi:hypothetical protein
MIHAVEHVAPVGSGEFEPALNVEAELTSWRWRETPSRSSTAV